MNNDLKQIFNLEINYKSDLELNNNLLAINNKIEELNAEINAYKINTDFTDYSIALSSGIITGIIDSIFIGEFSLTDAHNWGKEKIDNFVIKVAKSRGCKKNDLLGCVTFLENKYPIAADKATNDFGLGLQHHLFDFTHHASIVGLLCSILTQFTHKVYGTDVNGTFKSVNLKKEDYDLIGSNFHEKIIFGVINWFYHLVSDMAGSSSSIRENKEGTGIPGPLLSLAKEMSVLPFFSKKDERGHKVFSTYISKVFNGTIFKDPITGEFTKLRFDLRTEIGLLHSIGRQSIPVIINECVVRGFYFLHQLYKELKEKNDFESINWRNVLPFNSASLKRMLTISSVTFSFADTLDATVHAALESCGNRMLFCQKFLSRINIVGQGRAVIAVFSEINNKVKETEMIRKKISLLNEQNVYISKMIIEFEKEFNAVMYDCLYENLKTYMTGLSDISNGVRSNDSNLVIQGSNAINKRIGKKMQYNNQDEFDHLMELDEPFEF